MKDVLSLGSGPIVSARAARAHAMKNCVSVIFAVARLVETELTGESRDWLSRLRTATSRLRDLVAEPLDDDIVEDRAANASVEVIVQSGGGDLVCDAPAVRLPRRVASEGACAR